MRRFLPWLLAQGCVVLAADTGGECEVDTTSSGSVSFDGAERDGTMAEPHLESDAEGACLTALTATLELGQGCSMYVQADGTGDRLPIFDVSLSGEDGCGLQEVGWSVADFGDSAVVVTGDLQPTDSEVTWCHEGTLTVELDLVVESLSGETAAIAGAVTLTGVSYVDAGDGVCD